MAQGPMPAPGIGTPDWEQQMRGIWDRTRGAPQAAPAPQQVAGGPQMFMPGDTVRVMDVNGPYVGTVTGYDGKGQALIASNPRNAWDAQPIDPALLRRLDGPLSTGWK